MAQNPPILCVSYNSCIDRYLEVNSLKVGESNKATYIIQQAAGKAISIAYILNFLGINCQVYGFIGNDYVDLFNKRLENVWRDFSVLPQRTRVNTILIDRIHREGIFLFLIYIFFRNSYS
jgi:fructose-1-phosphate kinase PfkB-like protein